MEKGRTYMVRPRMQPLEEGLELLAHDEGVFPVVGGAGVVLGEGADVGAVFDAGDVVGEERA